MKPVVLELVSLLSVVKMTSAWRQEAPYKLENGFLAYGSFIPSFNRSLSTTKIVVSLAKDKLDCGFACMAEAKSVSFNINCKQSNGFRSFVSCWTLICFMPNGKLQLNASFHHFSLVREREEDLLITLSRSL